MRQDSTYPFNIGDYELGYDDYIERCKSIFETLNMENIKSFQNSLLNGGYNNLLKYNNAYFLMGVNHKTITSVKFQKTRTGELIRGLDERLYETDLGYEILGDGTVPFYSSSISEQVPKIDSKRWIALKANHGEVADLNICIDWISDILVKGYSQIQGAIPKSKPYVVVRIACPVDVTTNKNGEELSSAPKKLKINSNYGRLDIVGKNDEIKMLCLDEDKDINIKLNGTDTGTMDYTIRYFDENNNLIDERVFEDIPITKTTLINTGIDKENKTALNIDEDGDEKVDKVVSATKNEVVNKDGKPIIYTKNIKLETPKTEIKVDESIDLSISLEPKEANDNLKVKYKSSDEKIATVNEKGRVKGLSVGKVTITAETENGEFKSSVELSIIDDKEKTYNMEYNNTEKQGNIEDESKLKLTDSDKNLYSSVNDDTGNSKKVYLDSKARDKNSLAKTGIALSNGFIMLSIISGL